MKKTIAVITALVMSAIAAVQAVTPQKVTLPTRTPAELRAHAMSLATGASAEVWFQGLETQTDDTSITIETGPGSDPKDLAAAISRKVFRFEPLDGTGTVSFNGSITTNVVTGHYSYQLFYGYDFVTPKKGSDGKWTVPKPNVKMRLGFETPIYVGTDVHGATLYHRDEEYGYVAWSEDIYVREGWMFFRSDYAGTRGQIVLNSDDSRQVFDIQTGTESDVDISTTVALGFDNYASVNDSKVVDPATGRLTLSVAMQPQVISSDKSDAPVGRISLSKSRPIAIVGGAIINGSVIQHPIIKVTGPSGQTFEVKYNASGKSVFQANEPGVWWISLDYDNLFGNGNVLYPPYPGPGGGVGGVVITDGKG